jgi:hypothetical protein
MADRILRPLPALAGRGHDRRAPAATNAWARFALPTLPKFGSEHAENVADRSQGAALGRALRRAVGDGGEQALRRAGERAQLLHGQHVEGHAGPGRPLQGGVVRRRRYHRRLDAAAHGHFCERRGRGAVRACWPRGCGGSRAGDRLRQSCLHAAEQRLPGSLFLHQGRAPFESRRGEGVVGVPAGGRARDLSRSAGRRLCPDRGAAGRGGCGAHGAGCTAAREHRVRHGRAEARRRRA